MELENLLLFVNFGTIKYLLHRGSRRNRLAGIEPIPVRSGNTGWGTRRSSVALGSVENVVIVPESCEMTVSLPRSYHPAITLLSLAHYHFAITSPGYHLPLSLCSHLPLSQGRLFLGDQGLLLEITTDARNSFLSGVVMRWAGLMPIHAKRAPPSAMTHAHPGHSSAHARFS